MGNSYHTRREDQAARDAKRWTLAERYELAGPVPGDELRVIVGRYDGATARVLSCHGRTIVAAVGPARLRRSFGRSELAPIATRILTGR